MTQAATLAQLASSGAISADTSGNVGVGTTTPTAKFQVTDSTKSCQIFIGYSDNNNYYQSNSQQNWTNYNGSSTWMILSSGGNLGINNTSPSTYDTSGRILAISGTATNTNPSVILMEGTNSAPGRGSFVTETFAIAGISNTATEITRITGTGSNGMSMYVRVTYTGHTSAVGNGTNYKAVRYDGGTTAVTQVETATSGSVPGITFDTATSNVLIIKLNSSTAGQTTNGVMVVQWYIPIDFGSNTWTIS